ncbi:6-phosphogluconolactonase [Massilia sp. PDC64]|nr:6-phosphogluconolactonase [Massilia sp. PDC64]
MRGAGALVACAAVPVRAHAAPAELVYVGTQGREVYALRFDPGSGALAAIGPVAQGARSTWTVAHPHLPVLYAVDDDNARPGRVIAYAIDRATGALAMAGAVSAGGNGTTFLALDATARTLLAANFASGSVSSIALDPDGRLGALVSTRVETGSGPHRRQAGAHAHSALADPSGRFVLVPDLGADRVFVYAFDRITRVLAPRGDFAVAPGSGPRHLAFGADGRFAYLVNELTAQLMVLRWHADDGRLAFVQSVAMDDAAFAGQPSGAEVAASADGRFVYAANRGDNALLVYRVDAATGMLAPVQRVPSGGQAPWSFTLHASGRWLLVAHQKSGTVNVFGIDPASGLLADSGRSAAVPAAVSVTVVR